MGAKRFLFTNKAMCSALAIMALFWTAAAFAEVHIVALGDSGIRGKGVPESQAYPAQLEAALRARGHQVTVTNQGVNGDTTTGVLVRLDSAMPPGTNIVILKIGINDLVNRHVSPDASPLTNEQSSNVSKGRERKYTCWKTCSRISLTEPTCM
jgi:acyl-CoA thioesterase I